MTYVLAIDQGTTSTRAMIFDAALRVVAVAQEEFDQHFPRSGWVEHDAVDLWTSTAATCRGGIEKAGIAATEIAAIGITNQRETTLIWDRKTGKPIHKAIVWQDRRTSDLCRRLREEGHEATVTDRTGLLLDPYFSATKVRWLLDNVDGARARAEAGELAFGTVDSWLVWNLTGGRAHVTDATNAARTMLYDIRKGRWSRTLCEMLDIPMSLLPEVRDCASDFGTTRPDLFGREIPILGIAGDQQAATVGQACFQPGMMKSTYGTGCFALQTQGLAERADAGQNVVLVPAFTGLGAPYWNSDCRGAIFGLTRSSGPEEFARAALESVGFQTRDLLEAMQADWQGEGARPTLRVDGGMTASDWTMQFLADILGAPVDRPRVLETTALGAAWLAGQRAGVYPDMDTFARDWALDRTFEPGMDETTRATKYATWKQAVAATLAVET